jgi:hypothetical protein
MLFWIIIIPNGNVVEKLRIYSVSAQYILKQPGNGSVGSRSPNVEHSFLFGQNLQAHGEKSH